MIKSLGMHIFSVLPGLLLLALVSAAAAAPPDHDCAETLTTLQRLDASLHHTWHETSMADGKPLVLSIREDKGALRLEFVKTGEGLWAVGAARICQRGAALEAQLGAFSLGPAAPWLLRHAMGRSPLFVLRRSANSELHVSTPGWSGSFAPRPAL